MRRQVLEELLAGSLEPVEALILDRLELIRVLQESLMDLHEHRRQVEGTPAHEVTVSRIRYFDAVLGWAQERPGRDLVLVERQTGTG